MRAFGEEPLPVRDILRARAPWWAKGALKLTLLGLPVKYPILRSVGLAHHGSMELPQCADEVFHHHYDGADFHRKGNGFVLLELGPGDSLFMALIGRANGASATFHVDVGHFANPQPEIYRRMARYLKDRGLNVPDLSAARSLEDVLRACNATYLTQGLTSLRGLPDASVDFIFSNSVLQHVRQNDLRPTLAELRRVLRGDGYSVHSVDLRDMMGQSLHHLRFPTRVWESALFRKAEFYTNRLRLPELLETCRQAGFSTEVAENNRWPRLPLPRKKLAIPFRNMPEEDLLTATLRLVLRPRELAPAISSL